MPLEAEILAALSAAPPEIQLDRAAARTWQISLQKALSGEVEDRTDYVTARGYRLDFPARGRPQDPWFVFLRVLISGVRPYVTQAFIQSYSPERWWSGPIRTSYRGWTEEDAALLQRLRAWYAENALQEVDPSTLAQPAPAGIKLPRRVSAEPDLFHALFKF